MSGEHFMTRDQVRPSYMRVTRDAIIITDHIQQILYTLYGQGLMCICVPDIAPGARNVRGDSEECARHKTSLHASIMIGCSPYNWQFAGAGKNVQQGNYAAMLVRKIQVGITTSNVRSKEE